MAATYPSGIRAFPTYANGDLVTPATINDPDLEITALETGLLQGLAHDLVPDVTGNHRSLGTPGQEWYDLVVSHNATVAGTLTVTGAIAGTGGLTMASLTVTGDAGVGGTFHVTGTSLLGRTLVEANTPSDAVFGVLNTSLNGVGAIIAGGNSSGDYTLELRNYLGVSHTVFQGNGDASFAGLVTVGGGLGVTGLLHTTGDAQVTGTLHAANLHIDNAVVLDGLVTIAGALTVTGLLHGTGDAEVDGTLHAHAVHIDSSLTVDGNVAITGAVVLSGAVAIPGSVAILGDVGIRGNFDTQHGITSNGQVGTTVATTPATIFVSEAIHGAEVGGIALVTGTKVGDASVQFTDWVLVISSTTAQLIAGASKGAAASRVYSWAGLSLQLTMGADSYHVCVLPITVGTPGA